MTISKDEKRFPKGDPREGMTAEEWTKTLPVYEPGMTIAVSFPKGTAPQKPENKDD
jgi:hypothetical protein